MIDVRNLTKVYKNKSFRKSKRKNIVAINEISMDIKKEEIYGLIGPNGAGKTTFIKTLSTLILPDSGDVMINGHDLVKDAKKVRNMIGVVTGDYSRSLYWRLTGKQNIKFFGNLYDMNRQDMNRRTDELLVKFGLEDRANDLVMNYSTGMKHKLSLARALLTEPPILLLDEPTTGIDPKSSYDIKKYIKSELGKKQDGLELCRDIVREMNEEMLEGKDFYEKVKDLVPDGDRIILKKLYFYNGDLLEEIDGYKETMLEYESVILILEGILERMK